MEQFLIDLNTITDQNQSRGAAQFLIDNIVIEKVFQKDLCKDFLNKCHNTIQNKSTTPQTKLYTLMIFKFLSLKDKMVTKIFSLLSGHSLLKQLQQLALSVDPRKSLSQKGKTLFSNKKDIGVAFMRLLLESLKFWGQKFPFNSVKQPTKFKKALIKLTQQKVTMPKQYIYYLGQQSTKEQTPNGRQEQKKNEKKQQQVPNSKQDKKKQGSQILYMQNKIQILIGKIQECQEVQSQQLKHQILNTHKVFQTDQIKFSQMNIYDNNHNDQIVDTYLKICEFIQLQTQIFKDNIVAADDVYSYCQAILINYDKIFNNQSKRSLKPSIKPTQSKMQKQQIKNKIQQKPIPELKTKNNKQNLPKESEDKPKQSKTNSSNQNKNLTAFFSRYQSRSKSPQMGFSQIKKSIEKQKKQFKLNPPRGRSPHSSNFGKTTVKYGQSILGSKLHVSGIFAKPPNPLVRAANYSGELVIQNTQLQKCLKQIKREQGSKRFRISNFKERYPLLENDHIQIGFKTESVYQKIQNYDSMIQVQIFLGNKTNSKIQNLQVYFQNDRNSLIYTNPQVIQSQVQGGDQIRLQILVIPKQIPFSIVNMIITYRWNQTQFNTSSLLPNSFLKFCNYLQVSKAQFNDHQESMTKRLKCQNFKLCHYFPPRKISHYIPELVQLTNYNQFASEGSNTDFQLGTLVTIQQKYTGTLRIIIRPDLTVVICLSASETKQEAIRAYKFYIQSLEALLKQVQV